MKTACITGASSGIGREFAVQLSKLGFRLILVARNTSALQELADSLSVPCKVISCDLTKEKSVLRLGDLLAKMDIDLLINNAGFGDLAPVMESDLQKSLDMIQVNITALHILTRKVLLVMIRRDYGYILNVASSAGLFPGGPYMATYYATKAYVTSFTSAIYEELAELNSNVHISMLCPGPVDTHFNDIAGVHFSLPGISSKYCVSYAIKQMRKGKLTIVPTLTLKAATFFSRFTPRKLLLSMIARQQQKKVCN